jgi:hypothetical protein
MDELIPYIRYITLDELSSIVTTENINVQNIHGNTILHDMCRYEYITIETIHILLQKGADPNIKNHDGDTPFHLLCINPNANDIDMIELMFKYKANPNINPCLYDYMDTNYKFINNDIIKSMICNGSDLNAIKYNDNSFWKLCTTTIILPMDILRISLQYNANLNIKVQENRYKAWYGVLFTELSPQRLNIIQLILFHNISVKYINSYIELNINHIRKRNQRCLLILQLLRYTLCGPIILDEIMENHLIKIESEA